MHFSEDQAQAFSIWLQSDLMNICDADPKVLSGTLSLATISKPELAQITPFSLPFLRLYYGPSQA